VIIVSEGARWSAGAVARTLGISPTTLRTWDHRYGLGPSTREEGKHRRYDATDVGKLRRMIELTGQGISPASAASIVLGGSQEVTKEDFAAAASMFDAPALSRLTTEVTDKLGVVEAWETVLVPFLVELGERAVAGGGGIAVEHVATSSITHALHKIGDPVENGRLPVVLAAAPEEQHSLPLDALAAALAERGLASRNLGARVPSVALLTAVRLLAPAAVVIWAHDPAHAGLTPLTELPKDTALLVGGPGWANVSLPRRARWVGSLREAVSQVETVLNRI
jgi:DNA-binding transcriptional MerR regulator